MKTALSGSSTYGLSPANPGLSATGLQNGETVSVLTGLSNSFGITGTSGVASSPYALTVAGALVAESASLLLGRRASTVGSGGDWRHFKEKPCPLLPQNRSARGADYR